MTTHTVSAGRSYDITGASIAGLAVTAAEGGIGYWSKIIDTYDYRRWTTADGMDNVDVDDDFVFYTIKYENPNDEGYLRSPITTELLRRGLALIMEGGKVRKDLEQQVWDSIDEGELGLVDADVADCILQLGLFGEVVYG